MKTFSILLVAALLLPAVNARAADSTLPPDVEKQLDPDILSGKRPKTVILMQSMILGLRDQPKLDADVVTIGFTFSSLQPAQRTALANWFQTAGNKVYLDLAPSNIYDTVTSRATAPLPTDLITRGFRFQIAWGGDKALARHAVNTDCDALRLGYFHNPRDTWGMKEGDVVELTGYPEEGSEVIIRGKTGMVAGKFVYGKTECLYLGAALGGSAKTRWEKNFWQWALGLKVPGAPTPASGPATPAATAPARP